NGAYRNIEAVYRFLTESEKVPPEKIIVMGYSVGSGPSCWLAGHYPVGGLILEAPFASAFQVVQPLPSLPGDRFLNQKHIRQCQAPILIFHGEKDRVIPVRNSRKLFEAAPEPKKLILVQEAGHYDLEEHLEERYWQEIQEFVKNLKRQ
ncbi:MAG: alpha/beta hydrolase, partial [Lentisphaerae bacterium]|nr:alpha/beta hydrolase [Lentisphaerota bacterium]